MANQWFKFYGSEYLGDPKMLALSASKRSCWITLLSYASQSDGVVKFLSEEQLMIQSGLDFQSEEWDKVKGVLKDFERLEMIQVKNEMITVKNWKKRQETAMTGYERVKKYRENKKNTERKDNEMITDDNDDDNTRIDKNRIEENRIDNIKQQKNEVSSLIELFKNVNPSYKTFFANKTERACLERLLKEHGREKLTEIIEVLPKTNLMEFAPVITSPFKLEKKLGDLLAFVEKQKVKMNSKKIITL